MNVDLILIIGASLLVIAGLVSSFIERIPAVLVSWCGLLFCYFTDKIDISYWLLIITGLLMVFISGSETVYLSSPLEKRIKDEELLKSIHKHQRKVIVLHRFFLSLFFAGIFVYLLIRSDAGSLLK